MSKELHITKQSGLFKMFKTVCAEHGITARPTVEKLYLLATLHSPDMWHGIVSQCEEEMFDMFYRNCVMPSLHRFLKRRNLYMRYYRLLEYKLCTINIKDLIIGTFSWPNPEIGLWSNTHRDWAEFVGYHP